MAATTMPIPATGPSSYSFSQSSDWLTKGLTLSVEFGGGRPIRALVDTGSNGVVISKRFLGTNYRYPTPRQPFSGFTYSSSGNTYSGEWVITTLRLASTEDPDGAAATTAPMLVRAVERACDANGNCDSAASKIEVAMLGVGFDREEDGNHPTVDANAGPAINPFLNVQEMISGNMPKAYVIGSGNITLGLTHSDVQGFSTVRLSPVPAGAGGPADWQAPQTCIAVAGSVAPQCGTLLLDTGLGYAIVQVPTGVNPPVTPAVSAGHRPTVRAGQQVSITLPGLGNKTLYRFFVGGENAPQSVQWGHNTSAHGGRSFMNISRFALSEVDYLYDATSGLVGFRWL